MIIDQLSAIEFSHRRAGVIAVGLQIVAITLAGLEFALMSLGSTFQTQSGIAFFCIWAGLFALSIPAAVIGLIVDKRRGAAAFAMVSAVPVFVMLACAFGRN